MLGRFGNRIYLYEGVSLDADNLADIFTSSSDPGVPENAIAPFAVASLVENAFNGNLEYAFGYLPAGDYTMVFACDTTTDESVNYDELVIPLPEDQIYEISLSEGENASCNINNTPSC